MTVSLLTMNNRPVSQDLRIADPSPLLFHCLIIIPSPHPKSVAVCPINKKLPRRGYANRQRTTALLTQWLARWRTDRL